MLSLDSEDWIVRTKFERAVGQNRAVAGSCRKLARYREWIIGVQSVACFGRMRVRHYKFSRNACRPRRVGESVLN
jgi:hypothetical protein